MVLHGPFVLTIQGVETAVRQTLRDRASKRLKPTATNCGDATGQRLIDLA